MANSARIDELRKRFDENPRRYFAPLANEYRKSGDLAQAVFILEEYLPQQQGHISGHIVYGQTLFELGRDEEAKRVFEAALSLDPENLIALRHLGHISRQAGDFDAARSWYQRLLEADPRDAEIEQLLGSLDSAAQAQAAAMAPPAPVELAAPPPPAPMEEVDDSPLLVEHLQEHDAPGAPPRASTHPLGPPPLPTPIASAPAVEDAASPPPLPSAEATEEPHAPEPEHELLDLGDFSFGTTVAERSTEAPPAETSSVEAAETPIGQTLEDEVVGEFEIPSQPGGEVAAAAEPETSAGEADDQPASIESSFEAAEVEPANPIPADVDVGFEPFSGLESHVAEDGSGQVGGLESYTFESPEEPTPEAADDVVSFYMAGEFGAPEEPVEPAEGFESVAMEFAQDVTSAADRAESPAEEAPTSSIEDTEAAHGAHELSDATDIDERLDAEENDVVAQATSAAMPTPVSSDPIAATPAAPIPVASKPAESEGDGEGDAFATETMAKLYMGQGHLESALGIYRTLAAKRPDDSSLRKQIEEIEDRVQRRRREPTPPMPIPATPPAPSNAIEEVAPPASAAGPTIRDFLLGIIRRGGTGVSVTPAAGGTIDALFGHEAALDDDLVAADTLAKAFAAESATDPMNGKPAREAASELSLDSVFRQPTAAHAGERTSDGFSFDQFFAGERNDDLGTPAAPGDPDDIEQFNAWLNGLKKS